MRFCNQCNTQYDADDFICPKCGATAMVADGIVIHAPDMAYEGGLQPGSL